MSFLKKTLLNFLYKKSKNINLKIIKIDLILINARFKIGDTIMLFPLIREIKQYFPDISIDILTGKHNYFMFKNNPYVNNIYILNKNFYSFFTLRKNKYDLILDTVPLKIENILYFKLLNYKLIIGDILPNKYNINIRELHYYDILLEKESKSLHTSEQLFRFLKPLGIQSENNFLEIYYSEHDKMKADTFISTLTFQKLIGINIDGSNRHLLPKDYLSIINHFNNTNPDFFIIILSLPQNRDKIKKEIKQNTVNNVALSYKTKTIFEVMALINHLDLLITPDTSLVHIAASLDIPIIAIYNNEKNEFKKWYPKSSISKSLHSKTIDSHGISNEERTQLIDLIKDFF